MTMLRRGHDLHGLAFLVLYIYTIFAQIGYAYFPEFSKEIGAYYGPTLFYEYWGFMFLSFILTFLVYTRTFPNNNGKPSYIVKPARVRKIGGYIFFIITIFIYLALSQYFDRYRNSFGYGGGAPMGPPWFGVAFWIFTLCIIILYSLFRNDNNNLPKRILAFCLFALCTIFFLRVTIAAGVRSPILYFLLSIAFYELFPMVNSIRFAKRKLFVFALIGLLFVSSMATLRVLRLQGEQINISSISNAEESESQFRDEGLPAQILKQDYFNPSHTLFVSMANNIIDPLEVIKSNAANALVMLNYPHLTTTVLERGLGIPSERGAGWAYHYFVEGYNAIGFLGVVYNALLWNLGMLIWVKLAQSDDSIHNRLMFSFMAMVIMIVMRSQNSAFIQFYWLILLPGLALTLLSHNSRIAFARRR